MILVAALVTACSGTVSFKNQQDFDSYVNNLNLGELPVAEAAKQLESRWYVCSVDDSREERHLVCENSRGHAGQSTRVFLSPLPGDPTKTQVKAVLTIVLA